MDDVRIDTVGRWYGADYAGNWRWQRYAHTFWVRRGMSHVMYIPAPMFTLSASHEWRMQLELPLTGGGEEFQLQAAGWVAVGWQPFRLSRLWSQVTFDAPDGYAARNAERGPWWFRWRTNVGTGITDLALQTANAIDAAPDLDAARQLAQDLRREIALFHLGAPSRT